MKTVITGTRRTLNGGGARGRGKQVGKEAESSNSKGGMPWRSEGCKDRHRHSEIVAGKSSQGGRHRQVVTEGMQTVWQSSQESQQIMVTRSREHACGGEQHSVHVASPKVAGGHSKSRWGCARSWRRSCVTNKVRATSCAVHTVQVHVHKVQMHVLVESILANLIHGCWLRASISAEHQGGQGADSSSREA